MAAVASMSHGAHHIARRPAMSGHREGLVLELIERVEEDSWQGFPETVALPLPAAGVSPRDDRAVYQHSDGRNRGDMTNRRR